MSRKYADLAGLLDTNLYNPKIINLSDLILLVNMSRRLVEFGGYLAHIYLINNSITT